MPEPRLEVTDALGRRVVRISKEQFGMGRRMNSDLHLPSGEVSRDHAEIVRDASAFVLRDRGSRYGTFVNDEEVKEHTLAHGDRIRLGRTGGAEMVFLLAETPSSIEETAETAMGFSAIGDLRQMAALLEGLRAQGSGRVLDEVLALVVDSAIVVGGAERGFVMLSGASGELEFKVGRGRGRVTLPGSRFETSRNIPVEVFKTGQARIEADLLEGDLVDKHQHTVALGIRNVLCVPLKLVRYVDRVAGPAEERRIGVLYLDSREKGTLLANQTRTALESLATHAAVAIENAQLYRETLEKARMEQEMQTAAEIQQALLPAPTKHGGYFDAAAETLPCRAIGGDFFDYIELSDGAFGFTVGDVSGKGPPAALLGAMLQGMFTGQAFAAGGPAQTIARINGAMVRRSVEARFVTLFYGALYPDGRLTYCNAGHNPPFLVGKDGVQRLDKGGMIVGLFDGIDFVEETLTLQPGDFLVVFSDGVSEALNPQGEEFEDARILKTLTETTTSDARERLQALFASVRTFTAGAPQNDDITVLVICYQGARG